MGKIVLSLLLIISLLGGCANQSGGAATIKLKDNGENRFDVLGERLKITTDKLTGCQYIIYAGTSGQSGITPLMLPNGEQVCGVIDENEEE
ncbi:MULTISPECIES: DUF6440 family protein [unclassified Psychrobacillus]|uniref:DUF6440 family protein n=1 Tax=unclassified Psychrobacillus TaxID=2636677 RepID=UPI0030F69C3E